MCISMPLIDWEVNLEISFVLEIVKNIRFRF